MAISLSDTVSDSLAGSPVGTRVSDGVAVLTLVAEHNRNALTAALVDGLVGALADVGARDDVHAVVLGHTGSTFCAGADLAEARREGMAAGAARLAALLDAVVSVPVPVVALIDGHVRAGGMGLVGACDLAVASPRSTFSFTEARLALAPEVIMLVLADRLTPRGLARGVLTADVFDAATALDIGLLSEIAADVEGAVLRLGRALHALPRQGLVAGKSALVHRTRTALREGAAAAAVRSAELFGSALAQELIGTFLAGRPARAD